jgi:hypothetical protein
VNSDVLMTLLPGKTITEEIIVNKLFDLSTPGTYTVQVRRMDNETKTLVISNTIKVTVTSAQCQLGGRLA